ncbi:10831_t:CDS:2, partial [Funneliformis caledonium]
MSSMTCYNYNREGHITRYCPQPRQQPRRTDRRPPYDDTRDKEYNDEEYTSEEYYEKEEYEVYLNTRSGPYPKNAVLKNKRRLVKFQNLPKTTIEELDMKESTSDL